MKKVRSTLDPIANYRDQILQAGIVEKQDLKVNELF